jgi:hypothetical protein
MTISSHTPGNLVSVNIGQADVKDQQVGKDSLSRAHAVFAPIDSEHFIALDAKICIQHFGYVKVIFNNQDLGFGVWHVSPT